MSAPVQENSTERDVSAIARATRSLARRPGKVGRNAVLFIKVFGDTQLVSTGDGKFLFMVSRDMDGMVLTDVELFVSTVSSSGIVQCQVRNQTQAVDMLSTRVQVDANEYTSCTAATQPVISAANDDVVHCDLIAIDVDAGGTNARGLGIDLTFSAASNP